MTGTGYVRQSAATIQPGNVVASAGLNNEFNLLQSAFNAASGHAHDGGTGEGGPITTLNGLASSAGTITFNGSGSFAITPHKALVQKAYVTATSTLTYVGTTPQQIVGLISSFTPSSASSLIVLRYTIVLQDVARIVAAGINLVRDSTTLVTGPGISAPSENGGLNRAQITWEFQENSPGTSAVSYHLTTVDLDNTATTYGILAGYLTIEEWV